MSEVLEIMRAEPRLWFGVTATAGTLIWMALVELVDRRRN